MSSGQRGGIMQAGATDMAPLACSHADQVAHGVVLPLDCEGAGVGHLGVGLEGDPARGRAGAFGGEFGGERGSGGERAAEPGHSLFDALGHHELLLPVWRVHGARWCVDRGREGAASGAGALVRRRGRAGRRA